MSGDPPPEIAAAAPGQLQLRRNLDQIDPIILFRDRKLNQESLQPLRSDTVIVHGVKIDMPVCEFADDLAVAVERIIRRHPNVDIEKASLFLRGVLGSDKVPDDLERRLVLSSSGEPSVFLKMESETVLRAMFPNVKRVNVNNALIQAGWWIPRAVQMLGKPEIGEKNDETIKIRDALLCLGIRLVMSNEAVFRAEEELKIQEHDKLESARVDGCVAECSCCYADVLFVDMVQCPEAHLVCRECLCKAVEVAISENRTEIPCLAVEGCSNISVSELARCLPDDVRSRLYQLDVTASLTEWESKNLLKCWNCGYTVVFVGHGAPMICPKCEAETCRECGKEWHGETKCEEERNLETVDKHRLIEEKMNEAVIRSCPECNANFVKEEGCNKMECPRCKTSVCYWCKERIPKDVGYSHFWRGIRGVSSGYVSLMG